MSNYKKMMGYGDKKKKQSKNKTTIVDKIKQEINEWNNTEFKNIPKRWSTKSINGLTEYEKEKINEGPAYEYSRYIKKIDKFEKAYHDAIEEFELFLYRKKGLKKEASVLNLMSTKVQKQWGNFWNKLVKGLL